VVRQLGEGKECVLSERGEADRKGFEEPAQSFAGRWADA
jgi:hypothetical protein